MFRLKPIAIFAVLIFSPYVFAESGLFVEPAITYEVGKTSVSYPSPFSNSTGASNGFGLAARVGFHISEVIFGGLDARYAKPHFTDSALNYDSSSVSTQWGPVLGMQMPIVGLRVWAGYILGGDLDPDASGNVDVKFSGAKGYRIGAGFRVLAVSLNLEYQQLRYDSATLQQVGPFATNATFDGVHLNNNSWIASVSFPLEL